MQINEIIDNLGNKANIKIDNELKSVYNENCESLSSDYDVVLNAEFGRVDEQKVIDIVSYPWSGAVFSDRIWDNLDTLRFNTRQILTQGIIRGHSISEMSKDLSKECNNSFSNAARLVRMETANIHCQSDLSFYKENGIKRFEFMASDGARTCEKCSALDGKVFDVDSAVVGENYPPIHPNCRCVTVAVDEYDEKLKEHYDEAVKNGVVSPLVDFNTYKNVDADITAQLHGIVASDGAKVKSHSLHFVDRVCGSVEQKRDGVQVETTKNALLHPTKTLNNNDSTKYITDDCIVSLNKDTGNLIQTNPKRRKK